MKVASRKNVHILAFTLLVVMLGYGIVMPIMPFLKDTVPDDFG